MFNVEKNCLREKFLCILSLNCQLSIVLIYVTLHTAYAGVDIVCVFKGTLVLWCSCLLPTNLTPYHPINFT